jgi:AraC-like DNA-binding protein
MRIRYDVEKMKRIISDLCVLTGISMSFLDTERRTLCSYKKDDDFCSLLQADKKNAKRCACSDDIILNKCLESKRFEGHICHAGLFDAAMPIIKDGVFAGIVLMGRLRRAGDVGNFGMSDRSFAEKYKEVSEFNDEQIESLGSLLPNVLFESAIFIEYDGVFNEIVEYIKANLREPLGIDYICKKFHVSKNSLYAYFKEAYGKTVNEFIVDARMERARQLLLNGSEPIYAVAESVGIDNHTYFCKLFKKKNGMTPNQYRISN